MKIAYHRLDRAARDTIREHGVSIAAYIRDTWPDGQWRGDDCGCTDDRCIGHHHELTEPCGCLLALLEQGPQSDGDERWSLTAKGHAAIGGKP